MKRIVASALITGMVAIPGVAFAHSNSNTPAQTKSSTNQSHRQDRNDDDDNAREQHITVPGQTTQVTVETNVSLPAGSVSVNTAIATAQAAMPSKTITKVAIEHEEGRVVYSVRFSDNTRVNILASDGTVLASDNQNDDNDHRGGGQNNSGPGNNSGNNQQNDDHGHSGQGHDNHDN